MDPIRPVPSPPSGPAVPEVRPIPPVPAGAAPEPRALEPAVSVDLRGQEPNPGGRTDRQSGEAEKRGFVRDADSRSLVFQVTDARTGDVVIQIPNTVVLKARAYAREAEGPVGERVARSA